MKTNDQLEDPTELINNIIRKTDSIRKDRGFMTLSEISKLLEMNTILDPFNVLIGSSIHIGTGNIIYPQVILESSQDGAIEIGNNNTFFPHTYFLATHGNLIVGNENEFGDGGVAVKANVPESKIVIGDRCRLMNGAQLMGKSTMGNGAQILGPISAQNCELEGGEDYRHSNAARRGGLLKGFGVAKNCKVPQGRVLVGNGTFEQEKLIDQMSFHPSN